MGHTQMRRRQQAGGKLYARARMLKHTAMHVLTLPAPMSPASTLAVSSASLNRVPSTYSVCNVRCTVCAFCVRNLCVIGVLEQGAGDLWCNVRCTVCACLYARVSIASATTVVGGVISLALEAPAKPAPLHTHPTSGPPLKPEVSLWFEPWFHRVSVAETILKPTGFNVGFTGFHRGLTWFQGVYQGKLTLGFQSHPRSPWACTKALELECSRQQMQLHAVGTDHRQGQAVHCAARCGTHACCARKLAARTSRLRAQVGCAAKSAAGASRLRAQVGAAQ